MLPPFPPILSSISQLFTYRRVIGDVNVRALDTPGFPGLFPRRAEFNGALGNFMREDFHEQSWRGIKTVRTNEKDGRKNQRGEESGAIKCVIISRGL